MTTNPGPGREGAASSDAVRELVCRELVELVTEYLDGALSPDAVARVERHLSRCHGCTTYVEQIRATVAIAGRVTPEAIPEEAVDRLLAAFRASRDGRGTN